ncbi:unnamed protein product [Albugo candida]|uniref:AAA+ ATPase domain-containing protein n=1 Tax=Albugo candida TaxID=65357 RepID=A0A024FZ48_9STRA|nr:unnamed protein product [Albugo candida]|eukprot:CCI39325.1 unnamed protein product [Albugo candida]
MLPWIEKYRPKVINDISHQEHVVATLRQSIASGQLPHLLFYGPPGTGKTSTIVAVARELYGNDFRKNGRYLELNASDDRGIKVVREKVKLFAQGAINNSDSMPSFKIIVLDEADSMTGDAQSALRRMMENYSKVTRFCLICNYVSRIIDPIASRCVKFRFSPLTKESMAARLTYIGLQENLKLNEDTIDTLLDCANGDLRKAINLMQSAKQTGGQELTNDEIVAVAGLAPKELLEKFWDAIAGNSFDTMRNEIEDILLSGYPTLTILHQLAKDIMKRSELSDIQKAQSCLRIAEADSKLIDGGSEYFQILDVGSYIMRQYQSMDS